MIAASPHVAVPPPAEEPRRGHHDGLPRGGDPRRGVRTADRAAGSQQGGRPQPRSPRRAASTLLGADAAGHDIFSRLLFATQLSLSGAALALAVSAVLGISAGLIAGYYGKGVRGDVVLGVEPAARPCRASWCSSPARAVLGPSIWTSMAIFGVLIAPAFYRVVYSAVTAVRNELFVDAARVSGLSDARIIGRHVLTVVRAPAIILAAGVAGIAIAIQAGLDFLGLGDPSAADVGRHAERCVPG